MCLERERVGARDVAITAGGTRLLHVHADLLDDLLLVPREGALDAGEVLIGGLQQLLGRKATMQFLVVRHAGRDLYDGRRGH